MSSRYRHRRTPLASTPFPSPVEPGEIVVNTANRQIAVGDASAGTLGQPKQLIAVRYFDVTASYVLNDLVVQTGKVYRANGNIPPGAFNATNWTDIGGSATAALVTFAPGGNVSSTNVQAAIAELDSEKAAVTYVDAADANLAASTQAGFDLQTTAIAAKADKTYVDSQNAAQNTTITGKADKSYVDAADALKADKSYVDSQNAAQDTTITGKVAKAGDTMTGVLTIAPGTDAVLVMQKSAAGKGNYIAGNTGPSNRWSIVLGDGSAESGGDLGSDLLMTGFTDAGVAKYTVLTGKRADGLLSVRADPTAALGIATKQYVDAKAPAAATAAEYIANSAPTKMLTPGAAWGAAQNIQPITPGATLTPDLSLGFDHYITLSQAGHTFADPTNIKTGQKGVILINQDGTGGRTITTWGGKWKFSGGAKPTLSTAPGAADLISYTVLNANSIFCTFSAGFA